MAALVWCALFGIAVAVALAIHGPPLPPAPPAPLPTVKTSSSARGLSVVEDLDFIPCEAGEDIVAKVEARQGHPITIGPGACLFSRPLEITSETTIQCAGQAFTRIQAPRGAIHARAPMEIYGCSFWRADQPIVDAAIGIFAEGTPTIIGGEIEGFTIGLDIYGSRPTLKTNANGWRVENLRITGSGWAGMRVRGPDANGGYGNGIRIYTSCEHASLWRDKLGWPPVPASITVPAEVEAYKAQRWKCSGQIDQGQLGSSWNALIVSGTAEVDRVKGTTTPYPPFRFDGDSQHSVLIMAYREGGQAAPEMAAGTVVIGGYSPDWVGDGLRIDGATMSGIEIMNDKDPANVVRVRMGRRAAAGTFLELVSDSIDKSRPLRFKAEPGLKAYREDIANQNSLITRRVYQDGRVTGPAGQ